ncbi:hypothetical protein K431DRAFT_221790 [Polychaeton citri CBS 116435]|uniref:Ubiquitin 3 binding protein But2 C-terminal domain-containing protein n=1 Tax=Polychaeton citri CBS 116435 TaxID=1314669 RepID=A0A9P4QAY2_9PEZI|nr:hypothetical protein K431DRAFT_221790 [Polychaeton citri CBS 116435]
MFNSKSLPTSLAALILAATSASASAPEVESSQQGVTYSASLPVSANTQVNGFVKGSSAPDGQGCSFQIVINNVPSQNAPYQYQIADSSVASAGGCPASSSLLNPYVGQPNAACDDEKQSQCAIGALSGKHGAMEAGFFSANYVDLYLSTSNGTDAFFGNKAFVVLDSNQSGFPPTIY